MRAKSCQWKFLPDAAKVQEWKFAARFEITNFRARIYKCHCWIGVLDEGRPFTSVEAWRVCESLSNESSNANGMLFEPYFEHSFEIDKSCVRVAKLAVSEEKVLTLRTKYPLYLVLAVIISTVGSYQTRVLLQQFLKTTFDFSSMWQLWI